MPAAKKPAGPVIILSFAAIVVAAALLAPSSNKNPLGEIVVYMSPYCGCCGGYVEYLGSSGFSVKQVKIEDVSAVKLKEGVPENAASCHTSVHKGYFIEGHVPIEAIQKLGNEKPEIDGIALPGMPSGSPGMGGAKTAPFIIYAVKDGKMTEFMRI